MRKIITLVVIGGIICVGSILGILSVYVGVWDWRLCDGQSGWTVSGTQRVTQTAREAPQKPERNIEMPQTKPRRSVPKTASRSITYRTYQATAYTWTGQRTFTETWPKVGRTIAVNPELIPLGSRIFIEGIGWRIAEDVLPHKSIKKGADIDIFVVDEETAKNWGRRNVRVAE